MVEVDTAVMEAMAITVATEDIDTATAAMGTEAVDTEVRSMHGSGVIESQILRLGSIGAELTAFELQEAATGTTGDIEGMEGGATAAITGRIMGVTDITADTEVITEDTATGIDMEGTAVDWIFLIFEHWLLILCVTAFKPQVPRGPRLGSRTQMGT